MQSGHLWQQIWRAGRYIIPVIVIAGLSLFQVSYRFGVGSTVADPRDQPGDAVSYPVCGVAHLDCSGIFSHCR